MIIGYRTGGDARADAPLCVNGKGFGRAPCVCTSLEDCLASSSDESSSELFNARTFGRSELASISAAFAGVASGGDPISLLGVASRGLSLKVGIRMGFEALVTCSPVAGVAASEERGPDWGSTMVDAEPWGWVKSMIRP